MTTQNRRLRFIIHMVIMMGLMLTVLIMVKARYFTQMVIWMLFSYIIVKEIIDYFRGGKKPKCDQELMQEIWDKLDRATKDIKSTV